MGMEVTEEMMTIYRNARSALNQEQSAGRPPKSDDEKSRAGLQAVLDLATPAAYVTALDRVRSLLSIGYGGIWECIQQAERELGIEVKP